MGVRLVRRFFGRKNRDILFGVLGSAVDRTRTLIELVLSFVLVSVGELGNGSDPIEGTFGKGTTDGCDERED